VRLDLSVSRAVSMAAAISARGHQGERSRVERSARALSTAIADLLPFVTSGAQMNVFAPSAGASTVPSCGSGRRLRTAGRRNERPLPAARPPCRRTIRAFDTDVHLLRAAAGTGVAEDPRSSSASSKRGRNRGGGHGVERRSTGRHRGRTG
jgi:hypothetical protein